MQEIKNGPTSLKKQKYIASGFLGITSRFPRTQSGPVSAEAQETLRAASSWRIIVIIAPSGVVRITLYDIILHFNEKHVSGFLKMYESEFFCSCALSVFFHICLIVYLHNELIVSYYPTRALRPQNAGLLVVPRVSNSRLGTRSSSFQAPVLWNQTPVSVRGKDTELDRAQAGPKLCSLRFRRPIGTSQSSNLETQNRLAVRQQC